MEIVTMSELNMVGVAKEGKQYKTYTELEWNQRGVKLFGEDRLNWKFVCPICGNIQSVEDFRQYQDKGATPASAYKVCIGRYSGGRSAFGYKKKDENKTPCDYISSGFFRIGDTVIREDGENLCCFPFYVERN